MLLQNRPSTLEFNVQSGKHRPSLVTLSLDSKAVYKARREAKCLSTFANALESDET